MKKADIVNLVADLLGSTKTQAEQVVSTIFDTITEEMVRGGRVDIAGFGRFEGVMRAARTARNPKTGETVKVPPRRSPKFKASKTLSEKVAGKRK